MTENKPSRIAHPLSIVAAKIVRDSQLKPGIWDFEEFFGPYIELMDLMSRESENKLSASSVAANEARALYLLDRGIKLKNQIEEVKKRIAALGL